MNLLISIVLLIVVWTQVPDFTNTFTTTQEVHEQKWSDLSWTQTANQYNNFLPTGSKN
jgi:hypothetical protein